MQFAENGCLQDYLETQNVSITWLTKYRLAWEIASGLDFIHRENIFHTDLHSRNILIDTGGKALITDFGLSKSVNKTIYTTKAGLFGVVPYVAPERMQNPSITYNAKCDIYSLGVIFWELSSCVIPFEAQLQDVMLAVNIIAGVREKTVPGTAVEYEMLYRRCWDGLPQNRPQMEIVLSELVELLASEQINPRPAAPRPMSPRPARPLSSDSMVAPGTTYPYENESAQQSTFENTHHLRPASPSVVLRPGVRPVSFAQGMAPLVPQGAPLLPPRPDRSEVRVSFLGDLPHRENYMNGHHKGNGTTAADMVRNNNIKPPPSQNTARNDNSDRNVAVAEGHANTPQEGADSSARHDIIPNDSDSAKAPSTAQDQEKNGAQSSEEDAKPAASQSAVGDAVQFLPPIPAFNALSITPHSSPSRDSASVESSMAKLPETAALALSNGISMVSVVSKLNMGSIRNIPTISPPPHGAPPPPPVAVAGHSNSPRVISPPSSTRPRVVSPPSARGHQAPRVSQTISPPAGAPPLRAGPSPSLGPIPRPPTGPPPSPALSASPAPSRKGSDVGSGSGLGTGAAGSTGSTTPRIPMAPASSTPSTSYKGKLMNGEAEVPFGVNLVSPSETTRPTPARQIPMGFPVVTPLSPPHWNKAPALLKTEPSKASLDDASLSGSPSSTNSTAPSSTGTSPTTNRRDFRPISFLTQQKHSGLIELSATVDQQSQDKQQHAQAPAQMRKPSESAYVPNPNNNIVPPSQLFMPRSQSPDLLRRDVRNSRMLGSPSLGPAQSPAADGVHNKLAPNPHLAPSHARPSSPAPSIASVSSNRGGGGFPVVEASLWTREPKYPTRRPSEDDDPLADIRSISEPRELRPQLGPSKESSSSTTTMGTPLSTSPTTQVSTGSSSTANTGITPPTSSASSAATTPVSKNRVPFDNFYSLADPYKALNHDDPADFFIAVTQSDTATIERMLKVHPHLIHDSNGFWPHPTPILVAARSRNVIETMKVLIRHGAALDRGDHNGTTVLHFVCEQYANPVEVILFLVRSGADCNSRDAKKRTPLMVLLQNAKVSSTKVLLEAMRALLKHGAQAKSGDYQQRSPLHYAILHCKEPAPAMEMLLRKGADVNARDWRKCTPLHTVLERMDNEENVQMLLLYGADPGLKNGNKRNALGVAAENLRVMSAWFLLENDLLSSAPESIKRANELCSKADGPDKSAKPLFKNMLSDWQGKEGRQRRIQLAQDCVLRVQRTPDMKTIDQTPVALEFLESVGQPIQMGASFSNVSPTSSNHSHR
ncbi:unnamed protein product [Mortierella alpina]